MIFSNVPFSATLKLLEMIPENFDICPFKLATALDSPFIIPPFP